MGLNSVSGTLETIKDILDQSLNRAHELEDKLKTVPGKIVEFEQFCDAFILGYVSILAEKIDIAAVQGYLESSKVYQKLKDQDISPFLDLPPTEDSKETVQWVEYKIRALEDFLRPLDLPNYDAIIEMIFEIINKALHIPDTTGDDQAATYFEVLETTELREDFHQLADLTLAPTEVDTDSSVALEFPKDMASLMRDLEYLLDYIEHLDADTISQLLHSIIMKFIPAGFQPYEADIEVVVRFVVGELKKIDFSQPTERVVRDIVHRLAELSDQYAAGHDSFATINKVIQKISAVVCYIVDHDLLTTIQIKKMKEDEELIPDKPAKNKLPVYKPKDDPKSDNNPTTILYTDDDDDLIHFDQIINYLIDEALAQLSPDMSAFAQRLMDGSAFTEINTIFDDLLLRIENTATEAWEALQAVVTAPAPIPLSRLVNTLFEHLKKFVDAVFDGINDLVRKLIGLASQLAQLVVNMVLGIRVPTYPFIYIPGLRSLSNVNIPCYLVALPLESISHIHNNK